MFDLDTGFDENVENRSTFRNLENLVGAGEFYRERAGP